MSLSKALSVVEKLHSDGVIRRFAVAGAVAAMAHVEAVQTQDIDLLVSLDTFDQLGAGLISTTKIDRALLAMGYDERIDGSVVIEGWPVQFLPASTPLERAALEAAMPEVIDPHTNVVVPVLSAEHVVLAALSVGRLKDLARIEMFLDQAELDRHALSEMIKGFELVENWKAFCDRSERSDLLDLLS